MRKRKKYMATIFTSVLLLTACTPSEKDTVKDQLTEEDIAALVESNGEVDKVKQEGEEHQKEEYTEVSLVDDSLTTRRDGDMMYVMGGLVNHTDKTIDKVEVNIFVFNEEGEEVDTMNLDFKDLKVDSNRDFSIGHFHDTDEQLTYEYNIQVR